MRELIVAYTTHPAILTYVGLALASFALAFHSGAFAAPLRAMLAALIPILVYPIVEYLLHRLVLHSRFLYRNKLTASLWKRIHFDHHQDPHRLDVLFGSPTNTLPMIAVVTLPIGYMIGGEAGAPISLGVGLIIMCVYEFCHCIQHLNYTPKSAWLRRIKKSHLAHHFHNEQGNYGITSSWVDLLFGTKYLPQAQPRSPSVFNLGYDQEEATRYPWVAIKSQKAGT